MDDDKEVITPIPPTNFDGLCAYAWGHCIPVGGDFFGKPSDTPHVCDGKLRHISKLHRCAKCQGIGHRILPTKLTKAGRQLAALIADRQKAVKDALGV